MHRINRYLKVILLTFTFALQSCANFHVESVSISEVVKFESSLEGKRISLQGYYQPSYEGSVLCETSEHEACVVVVLTDSAYEKYENICEGNCTVRVIGNFDWVDIEKAERIANTPNEDGTYNIAISAPNYHRIINVKSVKVLK